MKRVCPWGNAAKVSHGTKHGRQARYGMNATRVMFNLVTQKIDFAFFIENMAFLVLFFSCTFETTYMLWHSPVFTPKGFHLKPRHETQQAGAGNGDRPFVGIHRSGHTCGGKDRLLNPSGMSSTPCSQRVPGAAQHQQRWQHSAQPQKYDCETMAMTLAGV